MIAYFDCFSGISGDMTLGAFVDLGVPVKWLEEKLKTNLLTDFELTVSPISRMGIAAKKIAVTITNQEERNYTKISRMITGSSLPSRVKKLSLAMFEKLAAAESLIHGCEKEHVHFHEVGGVDAIVDIVGACLCVDYLGIEKIFASKIPLGNGFVNCSHGTLPVPAPATLEILKKIPVYGTDVPFELVTPSGAAIITTLADSFGKMPDMIVSNIGYGSGSRELETSPNLLRVVGGELIASDETAIMLETCIDDMNPEIFGFLMERLFEDGALDVWLVPVFMKKNRPGTLLQVLCHQNVREQMMSGIIISKDAFLNVKLLRLKPVMALYQLKRYELRTVKQGLYLNMKSAAKLPQKKISPYGKFMKRLLNILKIWLNSRCLSRTIS